MKNNLNNFVSPGVYIIEKDINVYRPPYLMTKRRRRKISNIFNLGYEDPLDNPQVLWGSTTHSSRKTFIVPVGGPNNSPEIVNSVKELIEKYK